MVVGARARIHAALAERNPATRDPDPDPEAIELARRDAMARARAGFSELERACMEDLDTDASGAITLSAVVIGEPGLGTIFDSIEIAAQTVSDPEVIACVRESMVAFVGDPPALPVESLFVTTMSWIGGDEDDARKQRRIFEGIVGAHHGEIAACQRNQGFAGSGTALLELEIGEDRRTADANVVSTNLPEPVVECIVEASLRWAFPADLAGSVYQYEFELPVAGLERMLEK